MFELRQHNASFQSSAASFKRRLGGCTQNRHEETTSDEKVRNDRCDKEIAPREHGMDKVEADEDARNGADDLRAESCNLPRALNREFATA